MHTVDDSLIELLLADRISLMDAMAHARIPILEGRRTSSKL